MSVLSFSSGKAFAVYTDGVVTHGAVFRRLKGAPQMLAQAQSAAANPADALAEIVAALRSTTSVPKAALFATDRAVFMRSELPVDPARPRSYHQMRELARWEAEPSFAYLPDWTVGDVLQQNGALTPEQAEQVRAEIEATRSPGLPLGRVQDIALRLGLIDRAARDMAIDVQERIAQPVSLPACGWRGAGTDGSDKQFGWLISAIPDPDRTLWVEAFRKNKIKLTGLLPGWGLAPADTNGQAKQGDTNLGSVLTLERHAGAVMVRRTGDAGIETLRLLDLSAATADETTVIGRIFDEPAADSVVAYGFDAHAGNLIQDYVPGAVLHADWAKTALTGLAAQALELGDGRARAPRIAPKDPAKPLLKNPDFYRVALILLCIFGAAGMEAHNRLKAAMLQNDLAALDDEFDQKNAIARQLQSAAQRVTTLISSVDTAKAELADLSERDQMVTYLQQRRHELPIGIMNALKGAAHPGLIMQSIKEARHLSETFIATAWSVTEVGAESFVTSLNEGLRPMGLSIADQSVARAKGPRGIDGFEIKLRIARDGLDRAEATQ
ncbi:MAG: hypothetical protein AAF666_00140 [Pseudomonadota bacterium]